MADPANGLGAALEAAIAENPGDVARARQLPLIPADDLDQLPAERTARSVAIATRGAGRPAGAINKRTADWRAFILARYTAPLVVMAETYSRPVGDLAAELGCSKHEAYLIQQKAAAELAPYLHGKMPVEIAINDNRLPGLALSDPAAFLAAFGQVEDEAGLPDLASVTIVQNQPLAAAPPSGVGNAELETGAKSHGNRQSQAAEPLIADQPVPGVPAAAGGADSTLPAAGAPPQAGAANRRPDVRTQVPEIFQESAPPTLSGGVETSPPSEGRGAQPTDIVRGKGKEPSA